MVVKVSIVLLDKQRVGGLLTTAYEHENKFRMLLNDDSFQDFNIVENKDNPRPPERIINFDKHMKSIDYVYEVEPELQTPEDKRKEMAVKVFWANHPSIVINEKPTKYSKNPQFNLINYTDRTYNEIKVWRGKLAICNKVNEMSYQEKVNLCYYYGENPQDKTENELLLKLVNFENGICLKEEEFDSFMRIWIKNEHSDKDIIINVRKALNYGIIEQKMLEGRYSYYLGETFIGTAFNDLVSYCKRESKIYTDHISVQVDKKEGVFSEKNFDKKINDLSPSDISELKEEARKLKSEGFIWKALNIDSVSYDVLKKHIDEAKEKKASKKEEVA